MKPEIRILGIDDAPHNKFNPGEQVLMIAPLFRGGEYMDGLLSTTITADGTDATQKVIKMINKSRNKAQISAVMTDGIAFGGFNVIDLPELYARTSLPIIVVVRNKPNMESIRRALKNVSDSEARYQTMLLAGEVLEYYPQNKDLGSRRGKIHFQYIGFSEQEARNILKLTIRHGLIPEPIRVAHLIGSGIKFGESKGRA